MKAVVANNLGKKYGKVQALQNATFDVEEGELFGFIGPDGAGKTTLFRILTTVLIPDEGTAEVAGLDTEKSFKEIRKKIGYMPGKFSLYQDLSVEENINFFATIFGTTLQKNYDLVKDIYSHIEPFKDRKAGKLSGGMKQKLALSCALIHRPQVLFLDEPTTGVDPVSRKEFWEMLSRLKKMGITILVSTPYMDEAILCDRIALMQDGKILQIDTPKNITAAFGKILFAVSSNNKYKLLNDLRLFPTAEMVYPFGDKIHYISSSEKMVQEQIDELQKHLSAHEHIEINIEAAAPTIEDRFIQLMQQNAA
ncbi:MAG: ABC transporter ATP-binding protein [Bacteroidia bacterium]